MPHPEVAFLFANGRAVDFTYLMYDSDKIDVFPETRHHALPFSMCIALRLPPPDRFVLDTHLGRLAGYLRMLGFDTLYSDTYQDDELAIISSTKNRILLTRDIGLLKRSVIVHGYFVRSVHPQEQVTEVL